MTTVTTGDNAEGWGELIKLEPVDDPLGCLPPLDCNSMLPPPLAPWIEDEAYRLDVPAEMMACHAIASASALLASRILVRPLRKDDWGVTCNLSSMVVANVAAGKTPGLSKVRRPFNKAHKRERKEWRAANPKPKSNDALHQPASPRRETSKGSMPAIVRLIAMEQGEGRDGTFVVALDEMSSLFTRLARSENADERDAYKKAMSGGQHHQVDLIYRDSDSVDPFNICVIGGNQPGAVRPRIEEAKNPAKGCADGLLQRFLILCMPPPCGDYEPIDEAPNYVARRVVEDLAWELTRPDFDPQKYGAQIDPHNLDAPPFIVFSQESSEIFSEFRTEMKNAIRHRVHSEFVLAYLGKAPEYVASIAAVDHCVCVAAGLQMGTEIGLVSISRALRLMRLLIAHFKALGGEVDAVLPLAETLLVAIGDGRIKNGDTIREVARGPARRLGKKIGESDTHAARVGLAELERRRYLRIERRTHSDDGRPFPANKVSETITLRPELGR